MVRPTLLALAAMAGSACADAPPAAHDPGSTWSFTPSDPPAAPTVDADTLARVANAGLPALTAVDPTDLEPTLDELADGLGSGCVYTYEDPVNWFRYFIGDGPCGDGLVSGFAQEVTQGYDGTDPYLPGYTGDASFGFWSADVERGETSVYGNSTWAVQHLVSLEDGSINDAVYLDGDLHVDEAHRPSWMSGDAAPNTYWSQTAFPDGSVYAYLDGKLSLDDPSVDALRVSGCSCTPAAPT
jgi:hypothetical protein